LVSCCRPEKAFELFREIAKRRAELIDDLRGESEGFLLRGHFRPSISGEER
jgi:hypothetical protein